MANVLRIIKGIVCLAIAVFIVMVIVGLYRALDAAPAYTLAASTAAVEEKDTGYARQMGFTTDDEGKDGAEKASASDGATVEEGVAVAGQSDEQNTGSFRQPSGQVPLTSTPGSTQAPSSAPSPSPSSSASAQTDSQQQAPASNPSSQQSQPTASSGDAQGVRVPLRVWHEPVYTTIHHDAVYETVHHDAEYTTKTEYYTRCNDCGYLTQGSIYPHQDATGHTGYSTGVPITTQVLIRAAYDEQVLVTAAWDEQVLVTAGYWE
jgi:hypothetical protein